MVQSKCVQRISRPGSQNQSCCPDGQTYEHEALRVTTSLLLIYWGNESYYLFIAVTCMPWAKTSGRSGRSGTLCWSRCPNTPSPSAATRRRSPSRARCCRWTGTPWTTLSPPEVSICWDNVELAIEILTKLIIRKSICISSLLWSLIKKWQLFDYSSHVLPHE